MRLTRQRALCYRAFSLWISVAFGTLRKGLKALKALKGLTFLLDRLSCKTVVNK